MFGLVLAVNLVIALLELFGIMEAIGSTIQTLPALGVVFSAIIGLIPGCAPLVLLISLWGEGVLSSAALLAGLITSAGTGYLVLFNTNKNVKQNIFIVAMVLMLAISIGGFFETTALLVKLGVLIKFIKISKNKASCIVY